MEEFSVEQITKRSIKGVFSFISRSFIIQVISFIRDLLLTILLAPSAFGVFFVVESFMAILNYFSDIGLAGALIQKKEAVTEEELQTTFTIQQMLIIPIVVVVFAGSSVLSNFLKLPVEGRYLIQAFVAAFFLSSLKTIPSVILERNLEFGKFVIPQVVETLFYSITVVVLAYKGYGVTSFTIAVLARAISGLVTMYIIRPWKVRISLSGNVAKQLLSYGIPLQINGLLALAKDNLLILFLGHALLILDSCL